jgi:hypothetical protein
MPRITEITMTQKVLLSLCVCILGTFFGTQLAEAALIVPYWKGLSAADFFGFYRTYGGKLHQFYSPLTIAATVLPMATLGFSVFKKSKTDWYLWLMAAFSVLFFSTFFVYFKEANLSFTERTITDQMLPLELLRWEKWHWTRVGFEGIAFICGLISLTKTK